MASSVELDQAFEMGRIEERSRGHSEDIAAIREYLVRNDENVAEIKRTLSEMRGAWKFGVTISAGAGVIAGILATLFGFRR